MGDAQRECLYGVNRTVPESAVDDAPVLRRLVIDGYRRLRTAMREDGYVASGPASARLGLPDADRELPAEVAAMLERWRVTTLRPRFPEGAPAAPLLSGAPAVPVVPLLFGVPAVWRPGRW